MTRLRRTLGRLGAALCLAASGCGDEGTGSSANTSETTAGEADGEADTETGESAGDGDGDTSGDGDGDTSGDGDGDSAGDGDGDTSGDGDGDSAGDGDGDGDSAGDGDGDTSGDGDGDGDPGTDIEVVITADNAYGFGYGDDEGLNNYYGGIENMTAGQIFNCNGGPEIYNIPAEDALQAPYLYIIAWADSSVTQGVLARFRRDDGIGGFGENVLTGDEGWEVCATGMNYSPGSGGPSEEVIDQMIVACGEGNLDPNTTSGGWVDEVGTELGAVAVGEDNTTPYQGGPQAGNEFPLVCQMVMPEEARWMWFNWDPQNVIWPQTSPFLWPFNQGQNPDHQFLIFRLAADLLPPPQ